MTARLRWVNLVGAAQLELELSHLRNALTWNPLTDVSMAIASNRHVVPSHPQTRREAPESMVQQTPRVSRMKQS